MALSACGGSSTKTVSDGDAGDSSSGGLGGTSTSGRGGSGARPTGGSSGIDGEGGTSGLGGTAGQSGAAAYPTMDRAEVTTNGVRVHFVGTALAFDFAPCDHRTILTKADGQPWFDHRPPCNQPYYLDGIYEENVETFECFGCDNATCAPFPSSLEFSTVDYVQVGFRPAPDGAGGEAGVGSGGAGPTNEIPDIERRVYRDFLTLSIGYFTDPSCTGRLRTQTPVTFDVGIRR